MKDKNQDKDSPFGAGILIYEVGRLMRRHFERHARSHGFNTGQWRTLWHLDRNPGISLVRLADILEMQPISLGRVIDRLVELGLVERRAHPTDRRAIQLYLREKAVPLLVHIKNSGMQVNGVALEGLSAAEQAQLKTLLERLKSNLCAGGIEDVGVEEDSSETKKSGKAARR